MDNNHIILVVEDDPTSCTLFRELFEREKISNYFIVSDGEKAIEVCKKNKNIGLVLLDIKLPGINGHETLRKIKKIRKNLPVVAQTACVMLDAKEIYRKLGFDDFIGKPIINTDLIKIIEKYNSPVLKLSN
ncbi:MAG: response regulator [Bacteroidales bacterium]|nr:MAG: response regulator [Bacteroidales bacterium]